ncbi:hypothetical protein NG799_01900 [Laspinema sp. D1]|uniref:Uncharacterized protein n=1 Tax=Laspinema palackyanum D2a TaxID=2953684 RepID=A0ABT2MM51_9CYAN|nr:hypothetical protein [Laspinema sp. D2a]
MIKLVLKVSAKFRDKILDLEDFDMTEEEWSKLSQPEKDKLLKQWALDEGEELDFSHATVNVKLIETNSNLS